MIRASTAMRTLSSVALPATPFHPAMGQSPSPRAAPPKSVSFSIVDVHSLPHGKATRMNVNVVNHDRLIVHQANLVDMISRAYSGDVLMPRRIDARIHRVPPPRWTTFTPRQSPAHTADCGLVLHRHSDRDLPCKTNTGCLIMQRWSSVEYSPSLSRG